MKKKQKTIAGRFARKMSVWSIIIVILLSLVLFYLEGQSTRQFYSEIYHNKMLITNEYTRRVISDVYVAVTNNLYYLEQSLNKPDSLKSTMERIVRSGTRVRSCGVSFIADYYPQKGHRFEIYAWRDSAGIIRGRQMNEEHPDYLVHAWYQDSFENEEGDWTPPYFDRAASQQLTTTYTPHIHDQKGRKVGLLGADVSLEWLRLRHKRVDAENHERFEKGFKEQSYSFIIDSDGTYLIHPDETRVLKKKQWLHL